MALLSNFVVDRAASAFVNGAAVSSLVSYLGVSAPDSLIIVHAFVSNTGSGSVATISLSDDHNLSWTSLQNLTFDGTNASRHQVFWAKAANRGRIVITATFSASVSLAGLESFGIMGADIVAPLDVNADAMKTESHTASAASAITGLSTTKADTMLLSFYGSRISSTNPGLPTSGAGTFVNLYNGGVNVRLKLDSVVVAAAQSAIGVTYPTASTQGSMIALALRATEVQYKEIRTFNGFDTYAGIGSGAFTTGELGNGVTGENMMTSISNGLMSLVTGRDGVGQAVLCGASSILASALYFSSGTGMWVTAGNAQTGMGGGNILNGEHVYFGFNVKIGGGTRGSAVAGYHSIFTLTQSGATLRATFGFDADTKKWKVTNGALGGTTLQESGVVKKNPDQTWVWVEVHLFRHASEGRIELYQQKVGGKHGPPWLTFTPYIPGSGGSHPQHFDLEKVLDYTGDTSIATLGAISAFNLVASNKSTTNYIGNVFDDFVFSTGDRMNGPCYVKTQKPGSDVSTSGWSPSTGTDHFAVVDETLLDRTDYLTASTGNPKDVFGGWTPSLSYTPARTHAVQMFYDQYRAAGTSRQVHVIVKMGSIEFGGFRGNLSGTADNQYINCVSNNPSSRGPWSYADAITLDGGPEVPALTVVPAAQSLGEEHRTTQFARLLLVTQEVASLSDAFYNTPMSPIINGQVDWRSNLHPIDVEISQ